jgi:hypothetical protein
MYIYKSYIKGLDKHAVADEEFEKLDKGLDEHPELRQEWEALDEEAAFTRLYDVSAMDIYMAKASKGAGTAVPVQPPVPDVTSQHRGERTSK